MTWKATPLLALTLLLGACSRGDYAAEAPPARLDERFPAAQFLQFLNPQPALQAGYAQAYYRAVDRTGQRATLDGFKQANGFGGAGDTHVIFRDTQDLGYGRNMTARRRADGGVAAFVENFQVAVVPGGQYTTMNLDAALANDRGFHVGTNAIEWSPVDADGDGAGDDRNGDGDLTSADFVVKFFTYSPQPPFERRLTVNMDGRGEKAVPVPCLVCHGGRADPLLPDGSFARGGDARGKMQPLDTGSFEYARSGPFARPAIDAGLREINRMVYESYAPSLAPAVGEWNSAEARALLESWYGGPGLPAATANTDVVPPGWTPGSAGPGSPPAAADRLYHEVVGPHCRACHLLRGTEHQSDLDFASFDKFVGFSPQIERLVFERAKMPLAALTFDNFFERPEAVARLASFLPGFSHADASGRPIPPGHPVADAGPDRAGPSGLRLNGVASTLASTFQWRVVAAPAGATASISDAGAMRPLFSASANGTYTVELVVGDGAAQSAPDTQEVTIDAALPPPAGLTFVADVQPVLQGVCLGCHFSGSANPRPPVFYDDPAPAENRDLYTDVRALVNLTDPESSPLLRKPSGSHHFGGTLPGFDLAGDRSTFDLFVNWMAEGAPRN